MCRTLSWRLIPDSIGVDLKLKWKLAEEEINFLLLMSGRLTKATGIKKQRTKDDSKWVYKTLRSFKMKGNYK